MVRSDTRPGEEKRNRMEVTGTRGLPSELPVINETYCFRANRLHSSSLLSTLF